MDRQKPTNDKVVRCIDTDSNYLRDSEERILYFFKEFVLSLSSEQLEALLLFVTASVQQPERITVAFTNATGIQREPVSHTCVNLIELPIGYSSFQEFRRELHAILNSPEAFVYSAIWT